MKRAIRKTVTISDDKSRGWGKDPLTDFFNMVRTNQNATFAIHRDASEVLVELDRIFESIGTSLLNPRSLVPPFFLYRSHSAFRAASATALAGQVVETFVLLRSCLEFASYGLYIDSDKRLEKLWFDRHEREGRAKSNFRMPDILKAIEARDAKLKQVFNDLYARCIDRGAHPNERAIHGSLEVGEDDDKRTLHQIYLHGDGTAWRFALQSSGQVGLCALFVFQLIATFTDRFMLLDLRDRLQAMRNRVDSMFRVKQRQRTGLILPSRFSGN